MRLLFVCSGNICRSPMAAEYMRHRAAREQLMSVAIDSAGLLDIEGAPASREAIQVLREASIDLSAHRSRGFREVDARASDLVVVMTPEHLREIAERFPSAVARTRLLRAFEDGPEPSENPPALADPIGCPVDFYRHCFDTIRICVDHLVTHLKHPAR